MKRAPVGTARCCAGFPSPAEQYQEPLGLRLPSKVDAFSADILDLIELSVKRPTATCFVRVEGGLMVGGKRGNLIEVVNLRRTEGMNGPRFLPACHMNKKTWTTIVLDGAVGADGLLKLLSESRKEARW